MIIGLEGVSCTGKTKLARHLAGALSATVVDCYFHCAPTPESMPPPESADAGHQLIAVGQLLRIEALRVERARAALEDGGIVVLDRTVDTILAHARAVGRRHGFDCDRAARRLVEGAPALIPDLTVLLETEPSTLTERASRRRDMPEVFYRPDFATEFNEHFTDPLARTVIRMDASRPTDHLAADLMTHLDATGLERA